MCLFRVKNILSLFIIPIFWNILNGIVFASLDSVNDLNDFKKQLNRPNSNYSEQLANENSEYKNFAEGGLITSYSATATAINGTSFNFQTKITPKISMESYKNNSNSSFTFKDLKIQAQNNSDINLMLNIKSTTLTKLDDGGANLFLGAPEVVHINGTSSIKPRKGVYYNKIVPRKGVDSKYELNQNNLNKCLLLSENECYVTPLNLQDVESFCCNKTDAENIRKQMPKINCGSCILTNISDAKTCQYVCFRNKTNFKKAKDTETQSKVENKDNYLNKNDLYKNHTLKKTLIVNKTLEDLSASFNKNLFSNSIKKSKPKITKVPDDVEFVDNLFSKSKKDVLMPILVSLFLLPLIGMLIFFIWKRTKDYWNKRYYKRMDFLIDGMYNDQYS